MYSFRSGVLSLAGLYSFRSSSVLSTLGVAGFLGVLALVDCLFSGGCEWLAFLGLVSGLSSPGLSSIGVDVGLLLKSYSAPNLVGSGTRIRKVAPIARLRGPWGAAPPPLAPKCHRSAIFGSTTRVCPKGASREASCARVRRHATRTVCRSPPPAGPRCGDAP